MTIASLAFELILGTACRSNHQRLALLALRRLESPQAGRWRDLLLHHHKAYLDGAKAPDERFKDFKNHVLHVQDGFWGGAVEAAQEWQRRTVRLLSAQDWAGAAYAAGVMSHYIVDPIQPFHTGQTEAENTLHRAVEQSFSKAFPELRAILEHEQGYPALAPPEPGAQHWLEGALKAGARRANAHYDLVIDHYDFAAGVKNPPAGLDQQLKDTVAGLMGYAAQLLGHVLDRSFAEAGVSPPATNLTLDLVFAGLAAPGRALAQVVTDAAERKLVEAMYLEYQQTGKVRATLPEDDREVRALYAAEVLNVPVSTLDCAWPRETGLAHGLGAPPRPDPRRRAKPAAPIVSVPESPPVEAAAPPPVVVQTPEPAPAPPLPAATERGPRLAPGDDVEAAPSIGPKTAARLKAIGIARVEDLLAAEPEGAAEQLDVRHITPNTVRDWQAQAGLACAVPDLSALHAALLVAATVRSAADLGRFEPAALHARLSAVAASPDGLKALREDGKPPSLEQVSGWISAAKAQRQGRSAA